MLGDRQWKYNDWLADACGDVDRLPEWRPLMYKVAGEQTILQPRKCTSRSSCMGDLTLSVSTCPCTLIA